jgi:hypothetical protein
VRRKHAVAKRAGAIATGGLSSKKFLCYGRQAELDAASQLYASEIFYSDPLWGGTRVPTGNSPQWHMAFWSDIHFQLCYLVG